MCPWKYNTSKYINKVTYVHKNNNMIGQDSGSSDMVAYQVNKFTKI